MTPEGLTATAGVEKPSNPFPGLRPFDFAESHLYFGRDGQSDQLIRKLSDKRFVAVVGTSGSGKSSLVRAGLLPDLFSGFMPGAGSHWRVALMRPGNDPLGNLARALCSKKVFGPREEDEEDGRTQEQREDDRRLREENRQIQEAVTEATLRRGSLGLVEAVRQNQMPSNECLLVVADQFEELFRFARAYASEQYRYEAAAFVKLLLEAARQREQNIYVVLTMRSDFLGDCSIFWDLPEAINEGQYLIPRMTRDQRAEAITGPVAVSGGQITQRLVNRLLNDMGDNPDLLPILQHALMRTWDEWSVMGKEHRAVHSGEAIDLCCYEAVGTMSEALSRHADEAYDELPDDRARLIAEKVFKSLTEKGEDNREVRRPTPLSHLAALTGASDEEVLTVLEVFRREGRSFVVVPSGEDPLVDISHESLIRNWQRLKTWVDEESQSAQIYTRLAETAVLHEQKHAALWGDPDLQLALDWRERTNPTETWAKRYYPAYDSAMNFLDASVKARDDAALKEERRRRREVRRTRLAAVIFFLLFLLSLAALVYANSQRTQAVAAQFRAEQSLSEATAANRRAEAALARANEQAELAKESAAVAEAAKEVAVKREREAVESKAAAVKSAEEARTSAEAALKARDEADKQKKVAVEAAENSRRLLYASGMNLAQQAYDGGSISNARETLYDHAPKFGERPGFDYRYLWRIFHMESKAVQVAPDVASAALADGGKLLVMRDIKPNEEGSGGDLELWDLTKGEGVLVPTGEEWVSEMAVSPDGKRVAFSGYPARAPGQIRWGKPEVKLAEIASPREAVKLPVDYDVNALAFSPDGRTLAVGNYPRGRALSGKLTLFDVSAPGRAEKRLEVEPETGVRSAAFSPDGRWLATVDSHGGLSVWEAGDAQPRCSTPRNDNYTSSAPFFSPDGNMVALPGRDGSTQFWAILDCSTVSALAPPEGGKANFVSFTGGGERDGRPVPMYVAVGYSDNSVRLWETPSGSLADKGIRLSPIVTLRGHDSAVTYTSFMPDGGLVSVDTEGRVKLWDAERLIREELEASLFTLNFTESIAFSPDGKLLAAGDRRGLNIFDAVTRKKKSGDDVPKLSGPVKDIAFSRDGRVFAAAAAGRGPRVWDARTFKELGPLQGLYVEADCVALSPDGRHLVGGGVEGPAKDKFTLRLWDVETGRALNSLTFGQRVHSVAFSPDGKLIAAGFHNGGVKTWDASLTRELSSWPGSQLRSNPVHSVAFSPDSRVLAATFDDGYLYAWEAGTVPAFASFRAHAGRVNSVAFSPDGKTLATAGFEKSKPGNVVRVWSALSFKQLVTMENTLEAVAVAFSPDGLTLAVGHSVVVNLWRGAPDDEIRVKVVID